MPAPVRCSRFGFRLADQQALTLRAGGPPCRPSRHFPLLERTPTSGRFPSHACPPRLRPQFSLQARQSATPQPFWMAYARAEKDWDVSAYIHQHTLYEHGHTWAWCGLGDGQGALGYECTWVRMCIRAWEGGLRGGAGWGWWGGATFLSPKEGRGVHCGYWRVGDGAHSGMAAALARADAPPLAAPAPIPAGTTC